MNISASIGVLIAVLVGIATCQQPNDPWYNGLNSDTDDVNVNCQVSAGHTDCLQEHGAVVGANDKQARCPAIAIFVACIKSECRNSDTFKKTLDALDSYCNSGLALNGAVTLVFILAVMAALIKQR